MSIETQRWSHFTGFQFVLELIFQILLFIFKALNRRAAQYRTVVHIHPPARALRSANQLLVVVPKTQLNTKGAWAFAAAAPSLPWQIWPEYTMRLLNPPYTHSHSPWHSVELTFVFHGIFALYCTCAFYGILLMMCPVKKGRNASKNLKKKQKKTCQLSA